MKKVFYIHPFLFALYPALFLYLQNISHFQEKAVIAPIVMSAAFSLAVYLAFVLVLRKIQSAAMVSTALMLIVFSYGRLREPLHNINVNLGSLYIGPDKFLLPLLLLGFTAISFLVYKYCRRLEGINKVLTLASFVLVVLTLANVVFAEVKLGRNIFLGLADNQEELSSSEEVKAKPDIYYFILDRYGGDKTLKNYGFENTAFTDFLEKNGFYIASSSTSNYPKTFLSLSSTLNMEYLDFLTQKTNGGASYDESIVTPLIQNNKVIKFLKNQGYTYIHVGSGWDPTRSNPYADLSLVMNGGRYPFADEFTSGFLQTTIAAPLLKKIYPDPTAVSQDPKNNDARSRVLYEFNIFERVLEMDSPKFVFAHILIPHEPYVLGKDCEPLVEGTVVSRSGVENYLNQLQCANKNMEAVVGQILSKSKTKPIIVIQADEGPLPIKNPIAFNLNWKDVSDDSINEKFPILNAYLLPDNQTSSLYPSITPVNSFRVIFNTYFGTSLPLLPDKNYVFEDDHNFYKFIDITSRIK